MTYIISFILFLIYTIGIFFVKEYYIFAILALLNIILIFILKENVKDAFIAEDTREFVLKNYTDTVTWPKRWDLRVTE